MAENDVFRPDMKRTLKQAYDARAAIDERHQGASLRFAEADRVRARVDRVLDRLMRHTDRHMPMYVENARKQILEERAPGQRHGRQDGPKPPPGAASSNQSQENSLREQARARAAARAADRFDRVERMGRRMVRTVLQDRSRQRGR